MAGDIPRRDANGNLIFVDEQGNPVQQPLPPPDAAPPLPDGLWGRASPDYDAYAHQQFVDAWTKDGGPLKALAGNLRPDAVNNGPGAIGMLLQQMGAAPETAGAINRSILRAPARMLGGVVDLGTNVGNAGLHGLNALNNFATGTNQKPVLIPEDLPGSSQWIAERTPFMPTQGGSPTADAAIDTLTGAAYPAVVKRAAMLLHGSSLPEVMRVFDPKKAKETSKEIGRTWADWARQKFGIGVMRDAENATPE